MRRIIFHIDCNSFFASCEMARDPSLKEKPVVVAGDPKERRGIVLAANYLAKQLGIYTTMPLWEAKKRCPSLVVRKPNFSLYRAISQQMFERLQCVSPILERASIDEGYLDVTEMALSVHPLILAENIQRDLLETAQIPVSIGIAPNKFLAKMASEMKKPLGITILRKRDVPNVLWPLAVENMHGVGKKTAKKLNALGVVTIGDLAKADETTLQQTLGIYGSRLKEWANGIDHRPVDPEEGEKRKSIGNSTTLPYDVAGKKVLLDVLHQLADSVSKRMKQNKVVSTTVQLTIRYHNFQTITRSKTWDNPFQEAEDIFRYAAYLLQKHWNGEPIRLLGITALDVFDRKKAVKQLDLFHYEEEAKNEALWKTIEQLQKKFGTSVIQRGAECEK
ncbi:DNA polymerase IV [Anoxybacillus ayderensis]|uniref:DNA polymerase IV n=1 Tax=Anoxybacillus sp. ST70 TaxID=2864180 RepID=UPI0002FE4E18|nr:DNA polymerase IV [Anoxybacillus sp. ST70]AXM90355.1 DNA polymerase IV [Anoxybacillus ayderensis G10]MBW9218290.1 DNA polymerase IV [Anoxybacillus sp. ST70]THD17458.1 DNA polymerase IV [Anoxybacillus ayderensis]